MCPSLFAHERANVTSARFAELNSSSIDISWMSGLRRTMTPTTPMKNRIAETVM